MSASIIALLHEYVPASKDVDLSSMNDVSMLEFCMRKLDLDERLSLWIVADKFFESRGYNPDIIRCLLRYELIDDLYIEFLPESERSKWHDKSEFRRR